MLYPTFEELVAYKNLKFNHTQLSRKPSRTFVVGGQHSPFRGQGLEFDSVRKYVPGDDIRNIDWRVTARTGSPHLKIFHEDKQRHILLCIDMNASMRFGTRKTFKSVQAARIAALLGWQGIISHDKVSACVFGEVPGGVELFTPKNNKTPFLQLLKRLSKECSEKNYVSSVDIFRKITPIAHPGSLIYFISDFMDFQKEKEMELLLSRLNRKCDVVFISVNDPADKTLIPIGRMSICSETEEKLVINTDSLTGRELYAQQWKTNRENLYQQAAYFGISLLEITTESNIQKDLWIALKSLSQRKF